MKIARINCSPS